MVGDENFYRAGHSTFRKPEYLLLSFLFLLVLVLRHSFVIGYFVIRHSFGEDLHLLCIERVVGHTSPFLTLDPLEIGPDHPE